MALRVGINGFGRIGRMVLRSIIENNRKDLEIVAINNRGNSEVSSFLLKHDTIHGKLKAKINHSEKAIEINGKKISMIHETEISKIDWKKHKVDIVLECTGKFNTKEKSAQHIKSGAKKVLVSAPCKGAINIIFGVNQKTLKKSDQVISAASCTTNCLAPVAKVINDNFGIETGFMTTIHSYTTDQKLLDNSHKDLRRARSAPNSIIPTTTGATKSLGDNFLSKVFEIHHRHKKDHPSGTALMLGKGIATGKNKDFYKLMGKKYFNKKSFPYSKKINFNSIRKGEIVGNHKVLFSSGKETITLDHEAFDRALYSEGAFTAAKWLMGKKPGLYSMRDVLNFK